VSYAEQIRRSMRRIRSELKDGSDAMLVGRELGLTASFGVSEASPLYDQSMVHRASLALRTAQRGGSDRVVLAPPAPAITAAAA
jgi:PleD family two-component response regulator